MGIFKKAGDKIVDGSKKVVAYDEVRSNWGLIKDWASQLNPMSVKAGRVETFENAYERLGLDEQTLVDVYKNWFLRMYLTLAVFVGGLSVALYFVTLGKLLALLPFTGFAAICAAQIFTSSFRMYQIRTRQLCPISEWLSNRSEWFPTTMALAVQKKQKTKSVAIRKAGD